VVGGTHGDRTFTGTRIRSGDQLEIREHDDGAWRRVTVAGELDLATAPALREQLGRLNAAGLDVRLDLSELRFIDCAGVGALRSACASARSDGRRFAIVDDLSPAPTCVFEILTNLRLLDDF
jgi:anti-anti-sigma factor